MNVNQERLNKFLTGSVISVSMKKTITVLVERKLKHLLYRKYVNRSLKVHAHDEKNECKINDMVKIEQCRPLSKIKSWRLVEILKKSREE